MFPLRKLAAAAAVLAASSILSCGSRSKLPQVGSQQYKNLCSAFYLGLAALQSGEDVNARKGLVEATRIAPEEPAGWLNLGLLQFRQQDFEGAYQSVATALTLVSENSRIEALLGVIESRRGKEQEAISHLTRAVKLDRENLKAAYALAQETERQNSPASDEQAQKLFQQILLLNPNNLAVLIDDLRLAAKRNKVARVEEDVRSLAAASETWPEPALEQLKQLQAIQDANVRPAAIQAQFLKNVLVRAPAYRQSLDEVKTPATSAGEPFLKFFKLPSPRSEPDASDTKLRWRRTNLASDIPSEVKWFGTVMLDGESHAVPMWVDDSGLHISGGAQMKLSGASEILGSHSVIAADLNYDFKTDIVAATARGLKIYQQRDAKHFDDVNATTKLSREMLNASYTGAWPFDFDLDGDLDLVLGTKSSIPTVLRNNGDGTFMPVHPFSRVQGLNSFASADIDGDGDPDVAIIDGSGRLIAFSNDRLGDFRQRAVPAGMFAKSLEITSADVNGDGLPDFVVLNDDGRIARLSDRDAGKGWTTGTLAHLARKSAERRQSLFLADLDNNGGLDIIANGSVFLGDQKTFTPLPVTENNNIYVDAADLDGDGLIDLVSLNGGLPALWKVESARKYHWQTVRPLAAQTRGGQRINSFGVGGEIEVRADLLTQKQIIRAPRLHFGMGSHQSGVQFARIAWPNGLIQTEFNLKADQTLLAEQRLKGSCPYLFAWDGQKMKFLKDAGPMSGALGAHDPDGAFAKVHQTRQWFRIGGDEMKPKHGRYRLSVTDEYWESYFVDNYELFAVDHPAGTEIFVDERVAVPPAPLKVYVTGDLHGFQSVRDDLGNQADAAVSELDGQLLDSFGKDTYPGIVRDHFVQLTIPDSAPHNGELYLIAQGSFRPWDDSTLVALNQGARPKPQDLSLEVLGDDGTWRVAQRDLGIPAGRLKTIVIDLNSLLSPGDRRILRLRTNLEIYWDRLSWAAGVSGLQAKISRAPLAEASLRHRGFSEVAQDGQTGLEFPDYQHLNGTGNRWPSLEGYYTRYGDIKPLLAKDDGRYAITTSGDEMAMAFDVPAPAAAEMKRDFVFAGNGWIKEGDYSFKSSKSLLPLPYPGMQAYSGATGGLEREKAYLMHPEDWKTFHTRYAGGDGFRSSLWD